MIVRLAPGAFRTRRSRSQANAAIRARWGDARRGGWRWPAIKNSFDDNASTGGVRLVRLTPGRRAGRQVPFPAGIERARFCLRPDGGVYILAAPSRGKSAPDRPSCD